MSRLTRRDTENYYKQKKKIDRLVKQFLRQRGLVVYGSRALNASLERFKLDYLERHTDDWDIYGTNYKDLDDELEAYLERELHGDYFDSTPANHPGTQKIKSRVTGEEVADFSKPDRPIDYVVVDGIRYAHPRERLADIRRSLSDPESKFRRSKDLDAKRRIELLEERAGPAFDEKSGTAFGEEEPKKKEHPLAENFDKDTQGRVNALEDFKRKAGF